MYLPANSPVVPSKEPHDVASGGCGAAVKLRIYEDVKHTFPEPHEAQSLYAGSSAGVPWER